MHHKDARDERAAAAPRSAPVDVLRTVVAATLALCGLCGAFFLIMSARLIGGDGARERSRRDEENGERHSAAGIDPQSVDSASTAAGQVGVGAAKREMKMYTLQNAKHEIDAIAKHAADIAAFALNTTEALEGRLDTFKREIESLITSKFADLEKKLVGEEPNLQTTAVEDLGARVAQLMSARPTPPAQEHGHEHGQEHGHEDHHPS